MWNSNQYKKSKKKSKYNDNNDMMSTMDQLGNNMFNFSSMMMNQADRFNDLGKRHQNKFDAFDDNDDDFGNTYSSDDSDERTSQKLQKEVTKYKKIVTEKNDEIHKLKKHQSNIHKQNTVIKSLRDENDTLKSKLKNNNQQIKEQDDQIKRLHAECYHLKLMNSKPTKNEVADNPNRSTVLKLEEHVKTLKSKIKMLENKLALLEHEQKETETENIKLKKENKLLKLQNIDTNNYKQWGVDEIVNWIVSIDPQIYGKYENALKTSLTEEEFNGEYLESMEESDIKLWGIKNFKHRKILMQKVKKLISKDNKSEGSIAPTAYI